MGFARLFSVLDAKTVIFIGPQGSGKGTQADLLVARLRESDSARTTLKHDTGASFRSLLANKDNYTVTLIKSSIERGELQPSFLPIYLWTKEFLESIPSPETHIVIDGSPRTTLQADALDEAFGFYGREHVAVMHLQLPTEVSVKRMLARGRADDTEEAIRLRLNLYDEQTAPLLAYVSSNPRYALHDIDGNRSIDDIQSDICGRLSIV